MNRGQLLLLTCSIVACSEAHTGPLSDGGSDGGLDPTLRVVTLDDAEWAQLCNWIETQRGSESTMYSCDGPSVLPTGTTCPSGHRCYTYYWLANRCLLSDTLWPTEEGRARWRSAPPDCPVTVGTLMGCVQARSSLECWEAYPEPIECAAASCTGSLGDAGL
jgi:hypothetical protein